MTPPTVSTVGSTFPATDRSNICFRDLTINVRMDFLIADTFTGNLAKLTGNEQKAAKSTAFDLRLNPGQPRHRFHKLDRARDPRLWSVRVNRDVWMIVHRTGRSLLLCYLDHHDRAYHWAERRKLVTHPTTGAAQLVEVRETVAEITVPGHVVVEMGKTSVGIVRLLR